MSWRSRCRLCDGLLGFPVLDLLEHPPSNHLAGADRPGRAERYPLAIAKCVKCGLLQLNYDVPPAEIFNSSYPLHSSKGSAKWLEHTAFLCEYIWEAYKLSENSVVVELGSNDGYLLRNLQGRCKVLGVDPADIPTSVPTLHEPFTLELARQMPKVDVLIAINTVAQIPDLEDFLDGVAEVLAHNGVAIFEFPNLVTTINQTQFDTIYHEHYSYLSLGPLQYALEKRGLVLQDVHHLGTHGGSLRVTISRHGKPSKAVYVQIHEEDELDLYAFEQRVRALQKQFMSFLVSANHAGYKVAAYGASARGSTFLNSCIVTSADITMIADMSPAKIGKFAPGTRIPIVSEEDLIASNPAFVVLLSWTWKDEAIKRLRNRGYAGMFVTAIPEFRFVE